MENDRNLHDALLNDQALWNRLREIALRVREDEEWDNCSLTSRVESDRNVFDSVEVASAFNEFIKNRLPFLSPITANDLVEIARQQLSGIEFDTEFDSEESQKAIQRFCAMAMAEIGDTFERPGQVEIDMGQWLAESGTDSKRTERFHAYWKSNDFTLDLIASPHRLIQVLPRFDFHVVGRLRGCCSNAGLAAAERWFGELAPSISKTIACCTTRGERSNTTYAQIVDEIERMGKEILSEDPSWNAPNQYGIPPEDLSPLSFLTAEAGIGRQIFDRCLFALANSHRTDCDTFTRRLANAVKLVADADKAHSSAVGLTLSFAAIEAVICEKPIDKDDWGIEKQVKKLAPALLMPNPAGRSVRGNALYDLYCTRCYTIHGTRPAADPLELQDVRQIAAGVLRAAIEWRHARTSHAEPASWECFIQELNCAASRKLAMRDVSDLSDLLPGEQRRRQYQR